ncbi:MAG: hypothetical protein E7211_18585 [Clostridium lundense]|nr:hypothetical protein [Clostridium lundense]
MSTFTFYGFADYEGGKIARLETFGENIPVNIFVDNASDITPSKGDVCSIEVCGEGSDLSFFATEEEYQVSGHRMATISLIPVGTFPLNPNDKQFHQSPHILFSGIVRSVEWNPSAEDDEANCCLTIETLDITLTLYCRNEAPVEAGYIVHGVAWLYGDMIV